MDELSRGAEAIVYHAGDRIIKVRPIKPFRHERIDQSIRRSRTRREAKVLAKLADEGLAAPRLLDVDDRDMRIEMTFLSGSRLRDVFVDDVDGFARQVGTLIAKMHGMDLIHGDLTTSNLLVVEGKVHVIDFGLSFFSHKVEDMAVDLNVLFRTLEATHNDLLKTVWPVVLETYKKGFSRADEVFDRLDKVQSRGRNKAK